MNSPDAKIKAKVESIFGKDFPLIQAVIDHLASDLGSVCKQAEKSAKKDWYARLNKKQIMAALTKLVMPRQKTIPPTGGGNTVG